MPTRLERNLPNNPDKYVWLIRRSINIGGA